MPALEDASREMKGVHKAQRMMAHYAIIVLARQTKGEQPHLPT